MAPRTILHLIDTGGPGGAETVFLDLLTGLNPHRWRSVPVVPEDDWLARALRARGVEPVILPSRRRFDLPFLRDLLRLAHRTGTELIQAHLLASGVYGSAVAALRGIPLVCTFHGQADIPHGDAYRGAKLRILGRRGNRVVFVSESLRRAFQAHHGFGALGARVIHNGIDPSAFGRVRDEAVREELGVRPGELLVGAIGNIRPPKAYPVLLHAAALLLRRSPAYRFVVVGDTRSPLFPELLALRRQLGLEERLIFTGFREDAPRILAALDVLVVSSAAEGFSLSTVQALACGVPVVATRSGGPEEILQEGTRGVLVETGSPAAIAEAVHRLVTDPERRGAMVERGRARVREAFTLSTMVKRYEALYGECLGEPDRALAVSA